MSRLLAIGCTIIGAITGTWLGASLGTAIEGTWDARPHVVVCRLLGAIAGAYLLPAVMQDFTQDPQ